MFFSFRGLDCEFSTGESVPCRNKRPSTPDNQRGVSCNRIGTHRWKYSFVRIAELIVFLSKKYKIDYEDEQCMTQIDENLSNSCRNNATCIDRINEYSCQYTKIFST